MAAAQNPIRVLVEAKRLELAQARKRLEELMDEAAHLRALAKAPGSLMPGSPYKLAGGTGRESTIRQALPPLRSLISSLEKEVAELDLQADELDQKAQEAILNGMDPNAAYSAELTKLQTKATAITVLKWAGIIGAALLLLYFGRKLFLRIANR
jgi:chromosome segregation ATPase